MGTILRTKGGPWVDELELSDEESDVNVDGPRSGGSPTKTSGSLWRQTDPRGLLSGAVEGRLRGRGAAAAAAAATAELDGPAKAPAGGGGK